MVGASGFDPLTPGPPCQCATRLRHAPIFPKQSNDRAFYILPAVWSTEKTAGHQEVTKPLVPMVEVHNVTRVQLSHALPERISACPNKSSVAWHEDTLSKEGMLFKSFWNQRIPKDLHGQRVGHLINLQPFRGEVICIFPSALPPARSLTSDL